MTNAEIEKIRDLMKDRVFATKDELLKFIIELNPARKPTNLRFYLFDLVRANVIYKFDEVRYKFNGNLRQFEYTFTESDREIKEKIESRFSDIESCIWNTSFLAQYLNLLPTDYFTFVETEKIYINLIFDFLRNDYNVLVNPSQKELDIYSRKNNQIILRKLVTRSPLNKSYDNYIGINRKSYKVKTTVLNPKLEKILVDIFVESNNFSVFTELDQIFVGLLKKYCINFQKLFYYAKNRGIYEELRYFLVEELRYNLENGEMI